MCFAFVLVCGFLFVWITRIYFIVIAVVTTLAHIPALSQREASHLVLFHCLMISVTSVSPQSLNPSSILQHCPTSCRHICAQFSFNNVGLKNKTLRRLLFKWTMYMLTWELCKIRRSIYFGFVLLTWHLQFLWIFVF